VARLAVGPRSVLLFDGEMLDDATGPWRARFYIEGAALGAFDVSRGTRARRGFRGDLRGQRPGLPCGGRRPPLSSATGGRLGGAVVELLLQQPAPRGWWSG